MKKLVLHMTVLLLIILCATLCGCGGLGDFTPPDYNADIEIVLPDDIDLDNFSPEEDKTYYTSPGLQLSIEVNGEFFVMDYFTVEGDKRVYDNLYLYEGDYFYMLTSDYKDLYASLADSSDFEFAEEEKEMGEDIQINVKKAGIYKLTFDVKTLKFDMEYKAQIDTPVYYTIKNCTVYSVATSWVEMEVNPEDEDEFVIKNFSVAEGKIISFYNRLHTSNYKVTLDGGTNNKLASVRKSSVTVNVGGSYNIYINRKSYVVRLELINPDTASYGCIYYDGEDFIELEPYEADAPYLFRQRIEVTTKYTTSLPDFHSTAYQTYDLTAVDTDNILTASGQSFREPGIYDLIINLKTFEITVLRAAE